MKVKILNLDGVPDSLGEVIEYAGVKVLDCNVSVVLNFSNEIRDNIGVARLVRLKDGVYAEIEIRGAWKLDLESIKRLTPAAGGVIFERTGNTIKRCEITHVGLCFGPNCDKRIKSIAEQLATTK